MKKLRIIIGLIISLLLLTLPALTQTANTGALTGTVTDANGAAVSGAQIKVISETTGEERTVVSNEAGIYSVPQLLPGSYRVEFTATNFKKSVKSGLQINVTETTRLDVQLEVGAVQEIVTVTAQAEVLQTESSALGRVVDSTGVTNLPLVTRNFTQIATLSPGISAPVFRGDLLGRGDGGESGGNFRSHGAFNRDNNFQLNGVQSNDLQTSGSFSGGTPVPNPDTIQEFKVQTGQFDATYGRNAGANINVVTKGGGNAYHGTLFEFLRNDALNANDFFRNRNGQPRGVLKQNQFGFTLGGPLPFPNFGDGGPRFISGKDKLTFFGSYQGTRQINGIAPSATGSATTPPFTNDRTRAGLGALYAGCTPQPTCRTASNGVQIAPDGSNISAQALALMNFKLPNGQFVIPTPQRVNSASAFAGQGFSTFSVPGTFDEDQYMFNMDFLHTSKSKFLGRFFLADSDLVQPIPASQLGASLPGFPVFIPNKFRDLTISHLYTISSNLLNQIDFGFNRTDVGTLQQEQFTFANIGVNAPPIANMFPVIGVNGSSATGGNGQSVRILQDHITIQDAATYVWGRHTLRFGGGITRSKLDLKNFTFFGGLLFLSWPDLLIGQAGNIFLTIDLPGDLDRSWRVWDGNGYIQDDFKLTHSLTLNLGLRYERLGHLADTGGRNSGFDITKANPNPPAGGSLEGFRVSENFPGTIPAGVSQLDNRLGINGEGQNNFAPRVGFAWKLPKTFLPFTNRMVLRGGYGIYYTRATGQAFLQLATGQPFASLRQLQGSAAATATFANPFQPVPTLPAFIPYTPSSSLSINLIDPHYRPPISQHWSLNLQTDLGHNFLLETGYVGSRGTHLIYRRNLNQALLASPSNPIRGVTTNTAGNARLRVPILGFSPTGLLDIDSSANSWYHSLEASVTKRFSRGLQFLAAYTFAHGYNDAGSVDAGGVNTTFQADRHANYGRDNREHRFVFSYVYSFPRPKLNQFANAFLGGWSLAGVTTIQSGLPLTLTATNGNNAFLGAATDRVQLAPGCTYLDLLTSGSVTDRLGGQSGGPGYFNRACVGTFQRVDPAGGTDFGNSGVGIVVGPGQNNTDIAVIKRTPIGWLKEGANVEFRTEFFNAFNTPQFSNPSTNASSAAFGQITSTSVSPRIIQFGLKLNF
jgi:hypothetical protein